MRKKQLLVMVAATTALVALLAACGTSNGPELQFDATAYDAAAELQPAGTVTSAASIFDDAVSQPDANTPAPPVAAMESAPAIDGDSARHGYVHHDRIVQLARSASLSNSKMTHPIEARSSALNTLVGNLAGAVEVSSGAGIAEIVAVSGQITETAAVETVGTGDQPALDTPEAALQEASFTLVTVETDEGEQVIFVPSEGYEKVCPHRLRMASEFADF